MATSETLTDPITGTYSRQALAARLAEEAERARRYGHPFSLLLADLDYFKSVNDSRGHRFGDETLKEFARRLVEFCRKSDPVYRYGGDEFVVLLPETPRSEGAAMASRLLERLKAVPFSADPPLILTASAGLAAFPSEAETPEALFDLADRRLFEAKKQGRDRVVAEGPAPGGAPALSDVLRLIDRDEGMETLVRFFDALPEKKRGLLLVTGKRGTGHTRFLEEAERFARGRGLEVLAIRPEPGDASRPLAAAARAARAWIGDDSLPADPEALSRAILSRLERSGAPGLLATADDFDRLDWASGQLLGDLAARAGPPILGLACAGETDRLRRPLPLEAPLREVVELKPLARPKVRIYLRHLLGWEAPEEFVAWLHQETDGRPARLRTAVAFLVERGVLARKGEDWEFTRDFSQIALSERLDFKDLPRPHNLPLERTGLVGREAETAQVLSMLKQGRLVEILGPGGIGKTRLALHAAAELLPRFADGVFLAELEPLDSPARLPEAISDVLGISPEAGQDPADHLADSLREKEMLLILDNYECILPDTGLLDRLLRTAPGVRFLVASRERLDMPGEAVLDLKGLEVPDEESERSGPIDRFPAVRLFLREARRSRPDASPDGERDESERSAIAALCRLVEGSPLALEMAAAWTRVLSCRELLREIERSLGFLETSRRGVPERHKSLRAVFAASWDRLSPAEQGLLSRLSVFRGGASREAAVAVAGASLSDLSSLADRSLIERSPAGRFSMPETVRQFAAERLDRDPAAREAALDRHRSWTLNFLRDQEPALQGQRFREAVSDLALEAANIRAAWERAVQQANAGEIGSAVDTLALWLDIRGLQREAASMFDRAAAALRPRIEAGGDGPAAKRALGKVLCRQAQFLWRQDQRPQAFRLLTESRGLLERHGDPADLAQVFWSLAEISSRADGGEDPGTLLTRAIDLCRKAGDRHGEAFALKVLGRVLMKESRFEEAERILRQSAALRRAMGNLRGLALSLEPLGCCLRLQGRPREAEPLLQEALAICRDLGCLYDQTLIGFELGMVSEMQGDFAEAARRQGGVADLFRRLGMRQSLGTILNVQAGCLLLHGDLSRAEDLLRQSIAHHREHANLRGEALALHNLGRVAIRRGDRPTARARFEECLALSESIAFPVGRLRGQASLGVLLLEDGRVPEAREACRKAIEAGRPIMLPPFVALCLVLAARLLDAEGRTPEALEAAAAVAANPMAHPEQREEAARLAAEWSKRLPPGEAEAAAARGRSRSLRDLAEAFGKGA